MCARYRLTKEPDAGGYFINQEGLLELATDSTALSPSGLPVAPSSTPEVRAVPSVFDIPAAPGEASKYATLCIDDANE
jgi:hypothetical protein